MDTTPALTDAPSAPESADGDTLRWLERALPQAIRGLLGMDDLNSPLTQLPLAQLRLARALYDAMDEAGERGEMMGQLSARLGVRHNALTQAADRLIRRGLAERVSDPRDRRVVRMRLTPTGHAWVSASRARRRAHLTDIWMGMPPAARAEFVSAVRVLESIARRQELAPASVVEPKPLLVSRET